MKKLFSILMIALLLMTGTFTKVYAEPEEEDTKEVFIEEIDPDTLDVKYLGENVTKEKENTTVPEYSDNDVVRVSIKLEKPATLELFSAENVADNADAMSYRDELQSEQDLITKDIESKIDSDLDVKWNLTLAANIISANIEYGDIEVIKKIKGVDDVFVETQYDIMEDDVNTAVTTEFMVGATQAWGQGYTGAGSRVAIIDTGTNQDHIAFDPDCFEYSLTKDGKALSDYGLLTKEEISGVLEQLNQNNNSSKYGIDSADIVYKNSKIPFAFNYIDGIDEDGNITDHSDGVSNHGSHVAGIATANRYVKTADGIKEAAETTGAVGVAPDAQILVMKVFSQKGGGAYDSDYFAAIEDAVILKADAINLSLGSANPGSSFSGAYQTILNNLIDSNSTLIMSAGNSYNWPGFAENLTQDLYFEDISEATGGSPGSFFNSLGVAAANNTGAVGMPIMFGKKMVFYTEGETRAPKMTSLAGTYDFVYIDGVGEADEYETVDEAVGLEGKIVIVNRGSLSFYVKGNNAIPYSPAVLLVANNEPGTINMALSDYTGSFPMASIILDDALAVKDSSDKQTIGDYDVYTGTMEITDSIRYGSETDRKDATVTDFSSWGVPGSLAMKPEITAPGGNIWSVNGYTSDQYTSMSGTSMAAPHTTGMMGVLAQYVREKGYADRISGMNARNLMTSLMMSTATPMINDGSYVPVLQQGAGLADVNRAINAKSYIKMNENATLQPSSARDGKVKAEFGQDAQRTGRYSYSFTINNLSGEALDYKFDTDVFTQDWYEFEGLKYLDTHTIDLSANVSYSHEVHDVDRDGDTDTNDAQALLDYVTGLNDGSSLDLNAGEMDGVDGISSYDAQLLLECVQRNGNEIIRVPANGSAEVSVIIEVTDPELLNRENGGYVEGFTYVTCVSKEKDGAMIQDEHSIPFVGFYGSWTDAGMVDAVSALDEFYPTGKLSYFAGSSYTNMMEVKYAGKLSKMPYTGNPYIGEEEFPYDRLAINSQTLITRFVNSYIRNIGTSATVIMDGDDNVLYKTNEKGEQYSAFYHVNEGIWMNTSPTSNPVNKKAADFGLTEGQEIFAAQYAIPEYYALLLDNQAEEGRITTEEMLDLYKDGELGEGSYLGYRMLIDDTAPELSLQYDENAKTILAKTKDNNYLAYLAMMDVSGKVIYEGFLPEQNGKGETIEHVFDVSGTEGNAVVVFAGDYAANERAILVKTGDGPIIQTIVTPIYRRVEALKDGEEFVISDLNTAGDAHVLISQSLDYYTSSSETKMYEDENGPYFLASDIDDSMIWNASGSNTYTLQNAGDGGWLGYASLNAPFASWSNPGYADSFTYGNNRLLVGRRGMFYSQGYFMYGDASDIYVYAPDELVEYVEIDPENASSVELSHDKATLILGVSDELQLFASVMPNFLENRSVTWSSEDESIATVDEKGNVKGLSVGKTLITATSNQTPTVFAQAEITVAEAQPMDSYVFAQVTYGNERYEFDMIDLNDMSTEKVGDAIYPFYGGGEAGEYIYGNDLDNDYYRYVIKEEGIEYDGSFESFSIRDDFALLDGANIPYFTMSVSQEEGAEAVEFDFDILGVSKSGYLQIMKDDSLSYFDLTKDIGSKLVAITFVGLDSANTLYYYALSAEGDMYLLALDPEINEGDADFSLQFGKIGPIGVLPMSDDLTAYSMTYTGHLNNSDGVFISDNTSKSIYYVDFTEGKEIYDAQYVGAIKDAAHLSTLFDLYYDRVDIESASAVEKYETILSGSAELHSSHVESFLEPKESDSDVPTEAPAQEPVETQDPIETPEPVIEEPVIEEPSEDEPESSQPGDEVPAPTDPVVEEPSEDEPIIEEPTPEEPGVSSGSLNALRHTDVTVRNFSKNKPAYPLDAVTVTSSAKSDDDSSVVYTENIGVKNGYITVKYDPNLREYTGYSSDVAFDSINVDETNGSIRFAYASLDEVNAGDVIARFDFRDNCEDASVYTTVKERNDKVSLNEQTSALIDGTGHRYYLAAWMWGDDLKSATAFFNCMNNKDHQERIPASISVSTVNPTENRAGAITYTASAWFSGREYTDTRTIVLPATGHTYEFVGFKWSEDGTSAYAIFKDVQTGETIRVEASMSEVRVEPTADKEGSVTYTATVEYGGKTYTDEKTFKLDKKSEDTSPEKEDDKKNSDKDEDKKDENSGSDKKDTGNKKPLSILSAVFTLATLGMGIFMALKGRFLGLVVSVLSLVAFFLTQSLNGSLVIADKWSILLGVLAAVNCFLLLRAREDDDDLI